MKDNETIGGGITRKGNVPKGTLGTFAGVFTPSVLTILGIILFLRLGYVVGSAGLGRALLIIGLANLISILTSVSLSAIATNIKVKGGGDYYLISRTLGVEFGGSIGIVLFLAQAVSIAFYSIGFGEALIDVLPQNFGFSPRIIAMLAVSFLFIFAWLGADWATRFQYVVMALLAAALFSFFFGGLTKWESTILSQNWGPSTGDTGFWIIFAIFFPAVTGFTQGVSMSGDLKDPGKSLPCGTFLAVGISMIVYFSVAVVFAGVLPAKIMMKDYSAMKQVAQYGILIDAGVIAATLSSAMASFLGAPRILQSLASDRIFPFLLPFAQGSGPAGNPRRGVLLSLGISFLTISLGNLNLIAPIVSMFFLISYGLLNYATFYEARAASPSFRPRFRWFDYRLSLLGWLACLGVMMAINFAAGLISISVIFSIYQYLKRTAGPARWADSRRSFHLQRVREHLLAADGEPEHPRDWRPQMLAFSDDSDRREQLLRFASWLEGGSGFTTAVRILEGDGLTMLKSQAEAEEELRKEIVANKFSTFPLAVFTPHFETGIHMLIQSFGIGPLKANTALLNWVGQIPSGLFDLRTLRYRRNLRTVFRLGCNIVALNTKGDAWAALEGIPSNERRIDVWWQNDATSRLMLLLAYLMTKSREWEESKICVMASGSQETSGENLLEELKSTLDAVRIEAESKVIANVDINSIGSHSEGAALVFFPFRFRGDRILSPFGHPIEDILPRLPTTALVLAAEDIDLDAEPENGKAGEVAAALDEHTDALKKAESAEKEAAKAAVDAEEKRKQLQEIRSSGADPETIAQKETEFKEAEQSARKLFRKAAKMIARVDQAARELETLGVESFSEKKEETDGK